MSGLGPAQSRIKTDAELEDAIHNASGIAEIADLMHEAAIRQNLVRPDMDPGILNEIPEEVAPQPVTKVVVVNGTSFELQAADEAEMRQVEIEFYRTLDHQATNEQTEPARGTDGKFVTSDDAAAQADFQKGWQVATDAFKSRNASWAELAGEENTRIMSEILNDNNLVDSDDKLAAMEAAYRYGVENGLFQETVQGRTVRLIHEAQTPEQLRAALGRSPYAER